MDRRDAARSAIERSGLLSLLEKTKPKFTTFCGLISSDRRYARNVGGCLSDFVRAVGLAEVSALKIERDVDKPDEDRHFNQWADHGGESGAVLDSEDRHRHRDRKLEVVAGCREGNRRG